MTELYHYGIKGQRWGIRRFQNKDGSNTRAGRKQRKNSLLMDAYKIKLDAQKKRSQKLSSGDEAHLKKITDKERLAYARGRVKTMGGKANAIASETSNFGKRTALTALKGLGATLTSAGALGAYGLLTPGSFMASSTLMSALGGLAVGGVPVLALSLGTLGAKTIARGSRYVKNMNAIRNVKR